MTFDLSSQPRQLSLVPKSACVLRYRSARTAKLVFRHTSQPLPSATSKLPVTEIAPNSERPRLIEREPQRAATIQSP